MQVRVFVTLLLSLFFFTAPAQDIAEGDFPVLQTLYSRPGMDQPVSGSTVIERVAVCNDSVTFKFADDVSLTVALAQFNRQEIAQKLTEYALSIKGEIVESLYIVTYQSMGEDKEQVVYAQVIQRMGPNNRYTLVESVIDPGLVEK